MGIALPPGVSLPAQDPKPGAEEVWEGPPWIYLIRIWAGEYLEEGQGPSSVLAAGDFVVSQAVEVYVAPGILGEADELRKALQRLGLYLRSAARAVAFAAYGQKIKLDIGAELRVRGQADAGEPDPALLQEAGELAERVRAWVEAGVHAGARQAGRKPDPDALGLLQQEDDSQPPPADLEDPEDQTDREDHAAGQ